MMQQESIVNIAKDAERLLLWAVKRELAQVVRESEAWVVEVG